MDKKTLNIVNITCIILFIIIIFIYYRLFKIKTANLLILLIFYILILTTNFFTIGKNSERDLMTNLISYLNKTYYYIIPKIFNIETNIKINNDISKEDENIKEKNSKLILHTYIKLIVFSILCLIISIAVWYSVKKKFKFKEYINYTLIKDIPLLVMIIILQVLFYKKVVINYNPLNEYKIINYLIGHLKKKKFKFNFKKYQIKENT
jgi:ABC-type transport system involved in cytochrome bd biosynthesis fused ATPase/permease subunit